MKIKPEQVLSYVKTGSELTIDLSARTFRLDGRTLPASALDLSAFHAGDPITRIERLYVLYKHSVPSERSDKRRRNYFRALPEEKLSNNDLLYGENRETARAELELYVLCAVITGDLVWDEAVMGNWFWQSVIDPSLVILREWIEPGYNKN